MGLPSFYAAALQLLYAVDEVDIGLIVCEELVVLEESLDFHFGMLKRIAGMDDVLLEGHGEIAAYGSGSSLATVGRTRKGSYHFDSIKTAVAAYNHGAAQHGILDL